jgi:hypothetical protein
LDTLLSPGGFPAAAAWTTPVTGTVPSWWLATLPGPATVPDPASAQDWWHKPSAPAASDLLEALRDRSASAGPLPPQAPVPQAPAMPPLRTVQPPTAQPPTAQWPTVQRHVPQPRNRTGHSVAFRVAVGVGIVVVLIIVIVIAFAAAHV